MTTKLGAEFCKFPSRTVDNIDFVYTTFKTDIKLYTVLVGLVAAGAKEGLLLLNYLIKSKPVTCVNLEHLACIGFLVLSGSAPTTVQ